MSYPKTTEYPNITEYIHAIANLKKRSLALKDFKYVKISNEIDQLSGNFAVVFKLVNKTRGDFHAIKCFIRPCEDRKKRYMAIADFLKNKNIPYFINYEYIDDGLLVNTKTMGKNSYPYPVLKMDWLEGHTFGKVISNACKSQNISILKKLIKEWDTLCSTLCQFRIAHGDLKHDNIIVTKHGLKLIDYDGMYVPSLKGCKANEKGSSAYQHPERDVSYFDETLDYFSILVIRISLLAICHSPQLFTKYNTGENIIFSKHDFEDINQSQLMQELENIKDSYLQSYLQELKHALKNTHARLSQLMLNRHYLREITVNNPACFIVLIDRSIDMQIDRGAGQSPLQIIEEIIRELIIDLQHLFRKGTRIRPYYYISLIYYNSNYSNEHQKPINISQDISEIIKQAGQYQFFNQAIHSIDKILNQWAITNKRSFPPTVLNISYKYSSMDTNLLSQSILNELSPLFYNICNFYLEYSNNHTIVFPDSIENHPELQSTYENSSILPDCTCKFLQDNYQINCHNACKGLLINATFLQIYKFVHSIFKGPFHQGK